MLSFFQLISLAWFKPKEVHPGDTGVFPWSREGAHLSVGSEVLLVMTPVSPQIPSLTRFICQVFWVYFTFPCAILGKIKAWFCGLHPD